jgi:hypothetical protein
MGNGVTEHGQDAVAGGPTDVALVAGDDALHLFAIPSHQRAVCFRLNPRRQHRRIDQVGEENRQSSDLTGIAWSGQQVLGVCIASVDSEHLPRQGRRGHTITPVDRRHGTVNQRVDRGIPLRSSVAASRNAGPPVHHLTILSVRVSARRGFDLMGIGHPGPRSRAGISGCKRVGWGAECPLSTRLVKVNCESNPRAEDDQDRCAPKPSKQPLPNRNRSPTG